MIRRRAITVTGGAVGTPVINGTVEHFVAEDAGGIFLFVAGGVDAEARLQRLIEQAAPGTDDRRACELLRDALHLMRKKPVP